MAHFGARTQIECRADARNAGIFAWGEAKPFVSERNFALFSRLVTRERIAHRQGTTTCGSFTSHFFC